jgi:hypothetical protein
VLDARVPLKPRRPIAELDLTALDTGQEVGEGNVGSGIKEGVGQRRRHRWDGGRGGEGEEDIGDQLGGVVRGDGEEGSGVGRHFVRQEWRIAFEGYSGFEIEGSADDVGISDRRTFGGIR